MIPRTTWLVAGAAGYVLGARAGRERYDQIVARARRLWNDPSVQETVSHAQDAVKEQASAVAHKASGSADHASTAPPTAVAPDPRHG